MANVYISQNVTTNPTDKYLPVNNAGVFADSMLQMTDSRRLVSMRGNREEGIIVDNVNFSYKFGDFDNLNFGTSIHVNDANKKIELLGSFLTTTSAGGNSGNHLKLTINGTEYVLQLLNP